VYRPIGADREGALVRDQEIESEARHLAACRAALKAMRDDMLATETPEFVSGTDEVWFNNMYRIARARRSQELVDLPDVPLFFGRLDYEPGTIHDHPSADADRVYIGRRNVRDAEGVPLVVDWRAPVSTPFYRATRDDHQGVRLRRRYGFSDAAQLSAYEDEPLTGDTGRGPSALVAAEIGLHRLAYLLYSEPGRLGGGVTVVGPNRSFLAYIRHVLPALGEVSVTQQTIDELIGRPVSGTDTADAARLKGDARMAEVLARALWEHLSEPAEDLVYVHGSTRYRVARGRITQAVQALRGTTRYATGRDGVAQRMANLVVVQMERRGGTPDDRELTAVARSKPVRAVLDEVWPKLTPEQVLYRLLSEPAFLRACGDGVFAPDEQEALGWAKPYRSAKSAKWSAADAVLLDELADLIDRTPSLSHVMVDEAQDLSPMQCRALGRRCFSGSLTVLGDLAQGTSAWAADDWPTLLGHLGVPDARLAVLDRGFRVPEQIIAYAGRLLPDIAPGLAAPTSVRTATGALQVTQTTVDSLQKTVVQACRERLAAEGSTGVIVADAEVTTVVDALVQDGLSVAVLGRDEWAMESSRLVCVPASLAKGLEFDAVVVVEPGRIVAAGPRGLRRLYVALTRAVSVLHVVHADPLPAALQAA
jgi:DNA helicase IV